MLTTAWKQLGNTVSSRYFLGSKEVSLNEYCFYMSVLVILQVCPEDCPFSIFPRCFIGSGLISIDDVKEVDFENDATVLAEALALDGLVAGFLLGVGRHKARSCKNVIFILVSFKKQS